MQIFENNNDDDDEEEEEERSKDVHVLVATNADDETARTSDRRNIRHNRRPHEDGKGIRISIEGDEEVPENITIRGIKSPGFDENGWRSRVRRCWRDMRGRFRAISGRERFREFVRDDEGAKFESFDDFLSTSARS